MIIGMLIFPEMTQLDFTGPYEVFAQLPGCEVKVIARSLEPATARGGLRFLPDTAIDDAPPLDLLFVPGGPGVGALMEDRKVLEFLRDRSQHARYVTGELCGVDAAKTIQLLIEYNPSPPFNCGHPSTADAAIVDELRRKRAPMQAARMAQAERAAGLFCA